jgi:hypothetical protein
LSEQSNNGNGNTHKGGLRNFLEKKASFRKSSHNKNNKNSLLHQDNDEDSVVSALSMSSSFLGISWGNTSISNDLALSVASFAASFSSSFQSGGNGTGSGNLETEANVRKLMKQINDRIESRYTKASQYDERIQGCLTLACARYEAGSPNVASLVSMRRVHRLRHGIHKVNTIIEQLTDLHKEINSELEEAQKETNDASSPVLVDIDLESFRTRAHQIEELAKDLPDPPLCPDALLKELTELVPKMKQRRRLRGMGARRPTHSIKPV